MTLPSPEFYPPFNITRISHVVLTCRDFERSLEFYVEAIGLVVTETIGRTAYLRGIDEVCHHSLVLKESPEQPHCENIGYRLLAEPEFEKAERFFHDAGLSTRRTKSPGEEETLETRDPFGIPISFCVRMERQARRMPQVNEHRGGAAMRFDHLQLHMPDVPGAVEFYSRLGFRIGDYLYEPQGTALAGAFMYRKDNPWDVVFMKGPGPRLHHYGYIVATDQDMFRACDVIGALGYGPAVERGPGRHAMGHVKFVYIRDPDGHRIELLLDAPHQMLDAENEPTRWDLFGKHTSVGWGLPAQRKWFDEATQFAGLPPKTPGDYAPSLALEDFLAVGRQG